jgi:ecdysteroid 2-hydroxylase
MTRCPVISETKAATMTESVPKTDLLPYEAIPTPKGLPLIGTLFDLIKSGGAQYVHQYCDRRHQELGPIYRETMGNVEGVFIADAALMQKVCFYQTSAKFIILMINSFETYFSTQYFFLLN